MARPRSAAVALSLIFLAAHLALLPRTLEDLDSVNFALGVRTFDIAAHQPHPPGYPVFIALAKVSTAGLRAAGIGASAPRGLAIWSALGGAAALPALLLFFRRLEERDAVSWWATVIVACAPLFWFTAVRPLSDMLGFAAAMWAVALASGRDANRRLILALLLAGLSIGIRSQTAVLTLPVLLLARWRSVPPRVRVGAVLAFSAGALAWGIPMIAASGGLSSYLHALGGQAGEDFAGVAMLWTHHAPREIAAALVNTFIWPWDWWLGIVVCTLATAGLIRVTWRAPRTAGTLLVVFLPYVVFHLLFQETATTRYALPLLPLLAYGTAAAVEGLPGRLLTVTAVSIAGIGLMVAVPAAMVYSREGAPVFRAFDDMAATAHGGDRVDAIAMHAEMRRASEWAGPILPARAIRPRHGAEWLSLVNLWKTDPSALVWFAADANRTDLSLFDPHARDLARAYRWGFVEPPFVGGARPDDVDWYRMQPPGWMLDRGWALTAEVAGVTERDKLGPQAAPSIAWLKPRPEETTVLVGGRNLSGQTATLSLSLDGHALESMTMPTGFFLRRTALPAGALAGSAYLPLALSAATAAAAASSSSNSTPRARRSRWSGSTRAGTNLNSTPNSAAPGGGPRARRIVGASGRAAGDPAPRRRVAAALFPRRPARPPDRRRPGGVFLRPGVGFRPARGDSGRAPGGRARQGRYSNRRTSLSRPRRRPASSRAADLPGQRRIARGAAVICARGRAASCRAAGRVTRTAAASARAPPTSAALSGAAGMVISCCDSTAPRRRCATRTAATSGRIVQVGVGRALDDEAGGLERLPQAARL